MAKRQAPKPAQPLRVRVYVTECRGEAPSYDTNRDYALLERDLFRSQGKKSSTSWFEIDATVEAFVAMLNAPHAFKRTPVRSGRG